MCFFYKSVAMKNSYKDIQNHISLTRVQKGWCYYAEYKQPYSVFENSTTDNRVTAFIEITVMLVKETVTTSTYCFLQMNIVLICIHTSIALLFVNGF